MGDGWLLLEQMKAGRARKILRDKSCLVSMFVSPQHGLGMVIAYHLPRFNMISQSSSARGYLAKAGKHESLAGVRD